MKTRITTLVLMGLVGLSTASGQSPPVHSLKTYRNPLLPEREMADPDVIRFNGKYFLYATSDTRGYEVFASDDLVNWRRQGWAFEDPRGGAWAPDVFHDKRDGKFYLYYPDSK